MRAHCGACPSASHRHHTRHAPAPSTTAARSGQPRAHHHSRSRTCSSARTASTAAHSGRGSLGGEAGRAGYAPPQRARSSSHIGMRDCSRCMPGVACSRGTMRACGSSAARAQWGSSSSSSVGQQQQRGAHANVRTGGQLGTRAPAACSGRPPRTRQPPGSMCSAARAGACSSGRASQPVSARGMPGARCCSALGRSAW